MVESTLTMGLGMKLAPSLNVQQELIQHIEEKLNTIDEIFRSHYEDDQKIISGVVEIYMNANPNLNREVMEKALAFAQKHHLGQYRDSGVPYAVHPAQTGYILAEWGLSNNAVVTGDLHDVEEENEEKKILLMNEIYTNFGVEVLIAVNALSGFIKDPELRDKDISRKMREYQELLKIDYINHVKVAENITNQLTRKYMFPKNDQTSEQRQQNFIKNSRRYVLPLAEEIDRTEQIKMRLDDKLIPFLIAPYLMELMDK
ncbi:MAG: bifunctional (p)ppGpp synthetase/guanosine-3',5'-bis(diphosphate) 3'-pyrophosphohydrolase [Nanoarchaeota archaeon]|nr:bifunctional (p)ppGpp synthetase/guanosine-3',5'-bis(diphosphate) 3'-pyrophosphohydrolase [DPANN group archaeon]MBL7116436.1 bifunctional (p)ppGpp synthetase/guanosine-3',5'-bis(diphosphate) 3'-pyrophosphohydrolase [Nanoarchaeota archaeon]